MFDLDDTLFPERAYALSGFRAVAAWLERQHQIAGFYACALAEFEIGTRGRIFDAALRRLGQPEDPTLIQNMLAVYRRHHPTIELFEDAHWIIDSLRPHVQLGVLTDGCLEAQHRKVLALDLQQHVDAIVYSDTWGREAWKPSPRPFLEIMTQLACTGSACAYVGDNPVKDFFPARALGWQTVRVRRPGTEHFETTATPGSEPDFEVSDLRQVPGVLCLPSPPA